MTNGFLSENTEDIFSFEGTPSICKSGDNSGEATPVPISNTEVKLLSADDTWWETARESRTLPVRNLCGSMVKRSRHRPFTAVTGVRFPVESPFYFFARLAELADAPDLGSGGRPWGFKSLIAHHEREYRKILSFVMCRKIGT